MAALTSEQAPICGAIRGIAASPSREIFINFINFKEYWIAPAYGGPAAYAAGGAAGPSHYDNEIQCMLKAGMVGAVEWLKERPGWRSVERSLHALAMAGSVAGEEGDGIMLFGVEFLRMPPLREADERN
ncbi:hypothetical protein [Rhodoblastus sp.]|uniref:hypothetical protein n=1 Tax=Rhodoblastus sp. TaxID=1962975 RepID=UPI003F97C7F0